jgi:hypothetical protein
MTENLAAAPSFKVVDRGCAVIDGCAKQIPGPTSPVTQVNTSGVGFIGVLCFSSGASGPIRQIVLSE